MTGISIDAIEDDALYDLTVSSTSFGLAIASLAYPPLGILSALGIVILSAEFWKDAYRDIVEKRQITNVVLQSVFVPALLLSGYLIEAAACYFAFSVALQIAAQAKSKTITSLTDVFGTPPRTVWILQNGGEVSIPFAQIHEGDIVIVQAGEMVPADGIIIEGAASIDQRILTGESQPAECEAGTQVFATTVVLSGRIYIRVEQTGDATVAAEIGKILQETSNYVSTVQFQALDIADQWSGPLLGMGLLTLPVLGKAAALSVMWAPIDDVMLLGGPLSVLNYLTLASKQGYLVKDGRALELLQDVDTIVFDKTGTLTEEQPQVGNIYTCGQYSEHQILAYAASAEHKQTHPIALAIIQAAQALTLAVPTADEGQYHVGYGLQVSIEGHSVAIGSERFMCQLTLTIAPEIEAVQAVCHEQGSSLVYIAIDNELAGAIELRASIRPEALQVVRALQARGYKVHIISGDHENPTRALAAQLGVDQYFSETLPEQKASLIRQLQDKGRSICFIGDGINDALALNTAQVSVSLQGASTVATNTAQIILMNGNLSKLISLIDLAQQLKSNLQRTLLIGIVPSVAIIGGVWFLNFGLTTAGLVYGISLFGSITNAIVPLFVSIRESKE